jgi:hypothetical protein
VEVFAVPPGDDFDALGYFTESVSERGDLEKFGIASFAAAGTPEMLDPCGDCHATSVALRRQGG